LNDLSTRELTIAIKAEAKRLGFELIGVTSPEAPPHLEVYQSWVDQGHHGEMGYLATDRARLRRSDPRLILPGCRAILSLGIRYPAPVSGTRSSNSEGFGRVAAYAGGQDYHDVLVPRLKSLVQYIENHLGRSVPNRWYTDTGPLLEREFAQRAGLGWIGKNTCLINPQLGSYFLLAEILLGIDLELDSPLKTDHCGSCTRCIEACPTHCILPNRTLDATRCISYLTIELKGSITPELRSGLGAWVFGCDICQEVCPWNVRFAAPEGEPAFAARSGGLRPELQKELQLTPEAFNKKFKGSPVKRTKRRGYLRNVAVALGNTDDPAAVPVLAVALHHDREPLIRVHAAWALGQIAGPQAAKKLELARENETDPAVLVEIRGALARVQES
jgi:epoxyqueuosine reductase